MTLRVGKETSIGIWIELDGMEKVRIGLLSRTGPALPTYLRIFTHRTVHLEDFGCRLEYGFGSTFKCKDIVGFKLKILDLLRITVSDRIGFGF